MGVPGLIPLDDFAAFVRLMREQRVLRVRRGTLEVELHPTAFDVPRGAVAAPADVPDPDLCACGHSIGVQHSEAGCLQGCPQATCAKTGAK